MANIKQKITPCLWFDSQAEEAAKFYTAIFPNSSIGEIARYDESSANASGQPAGSVLTVAFNLNGQEFTALNGGPVFKFSEAISFQVMCETQEEVDMYWGKLSAVPESEQCGWCKDKYGLSWQIVPTLLPKLLADPDKQKAGRVMQAMLQMKKIDIEGLQKAYERVSP
ncbi:MAG TPA: VOC family protein [Candidatus Saccharimonadales bacterium]|nr:VOC family protein [Candidatus Saccharimonadales bacterium]